MNYYQHHVFMCTNQRENGATCCANSDAAALRAYAKDQLKAAKLNGKGKCRINSAGCLDRCDLGVVMVVYPEGIWYSIKNRADVDEIITEHLQNGQVVSRLQV